MLLRSNWTATCIAEHEGPLSLDSFCAERGITFGLPVPLERFIDYGTWVQQQVARDVDRRMVRSVEADRGELPPRAGRRRPAHRPAGRGRGRHRRVRQPAVVRGRPAGGAGLAHRRARRPRPVRAAPEVLVVGGGQSALESAALLHENGAQPRSRSREDHVNWLHGGSYHRKLGRLAPLVYAPTDVGPMGLSRIVAVPDLFRRLPRRLQEPMAYRAIRPAGALWLRTGCRTCRS